MAKVRSAPKVGRPYKTAEALEQQRQELLDAAVTTIRLAGASASLSEIAAAAGYSKALLYDVFESKSGFAMALSVHVNSQQLSKVFAEPNLTLPQRLRAAIESFTAFVEADPDLYRFLVVEARGGTTSFANQPIMTFLTTSLAAVSGFDEQHAVFVVQSLVGMIFAGVEVWSLSAVKVPREQLVDQLTAMALAAYTAAAS